MSCLFLNLFRDASQWWLENKKTSLAARNVQAQNEKNWIADIFHHLFIIYIALSGGLFRIMVAASVY